MEVKEAPDVKDNDPPETEVDDPVPTDNKILPLVPDDALPLDINIDPDVPNDANPLLKLNDPLLNVVLVPELNTIIPLIPLTPDI